MSHGLKVRVAKGKVHLLLRSWDGVGAPEYANVGNLLPAKARYLAGLLTEAAAEAEKGEEQGDEKFVWLNRWW